MRPGQGATAEEIGLWQHAGDAVSILRALPGCEGEVRRLAFDALRGLTPSLASSMLRVVGLGRAPDQSEAQALDALWPRMVQAALASALESKDTRLRTQAARTFGELGDVDALAPLLRQLDREPASMARMEIEQAVDKLGHGPVAERIRTLHWARKGRWDLCLALGEAARPALIELATTPGSDAEDHRLRAEAMRRLAGLGGPDVTGVLHPALTDPTALIRRTAVELLGTLGDADRDVPGLAALLEDRDAGVREAVLVALGRLGGEAAEEALLGFAGRCRDPEERFALAVALGRMGRPEVLAELLQERDPKLRRAVVAELGKSGHPSSIELLIPVLDDGFPEMRRAARAALEELGWTPVGFRKSRHDAAFAFWTSPADWRAAPGQPQAQALLAGLNAADPDWRRNAAEALGDLRVQEAVEPLLRLLEDPVADVAVVAAQALVALGVQPATEPRWAPYLALDGQWARCLELGPAALPALLLALQEPEPKLRAQAAAALGQSGLPAAVPALVAALADAAPAVRAAAAQALGRLGATAALPPLLELLMDADATVVDAAVEALGRIGHGEAAVLGQALDDARPAVRRGVAAALGQSADEQAPALLRRALDDEAVEVRLAALAALARLGGTKTVQALVEVLAGDREATVRAAAAVALGGLGDAAGARAALQSGLGDGHGEVREACIAALEALGLPLSEEQRALPRALAVEDWAAAASFGSPGIEALLRVAAAPDTDPRTIDCRCQVMATLGRLGDERALPVLVAALGETSPKIRLAAVRACGALGRVEARPRVASLTDDRVAAVRAAAVEALGLLGVGESLDRLARALEDPDEEVRLAAITALGRDATRAWELLIDMLGSPSTTLRLAAVEMLGQSKDLRAVDALCELLGDPAKELRQAATRALQELGWQPVGWRAHAGDRGYAFWTDRSFWLGDDPAAAQVPLLVAALRHADADRRRNAAEALGLIRDPAAVEPLQALLADPEPDVRRTAAQALLDLGVDPQPEPMWAPCYLLREDWNGLIRLGDAAVPELAALLAVADLSRRHRAVQALGQIGSSEAVAALVRALSDEEGKVRRAAAAELGRLRAEVALEPLLALVGDPYSEPEAAQALAALGAAAVPLLAGALGSPSDPQTQAWVAEALGLSGCPEALAPLLQALQAPEAALRSHALDALARLGRPEAAAPAIELLLADPDWQVRASAARLCGACGDQEAVPALRRALGDGYGEVRRAAVAALEALGASPAPELLAASRLIAEERWEQVAALGPIALDPLLRVVGEKADDPQTTRMRAAAIRCLAQLGDEGVLLPVLRAAAADKNPAVQAAAAWALGELALPECGELLQRLAGARSATVRLAALRSLIKLGREEHRHIVLAALSDPAQEVRVAAVVALGRVGDLAFQPLLAALGAAAPDVRAAAAAALGSLGDVRAIDPLCRMLADGVPSVRRVVRESLNRLGWRPVGWRAKAADKGYAYWTTRSEWLRDDPDAAQRDLLLAALDDGDPDRRRNAAEALGLHGDPDALPALQRVAQDDADPDVRAFASEAAASLQAMVEQQSQEAGALLAAATATGGEPEEAVTFLAQVLSSGAPRRRPAAAEALGKLGTAAAAAALAHALSDPALEVRESARRGLAGIGKEAALEALATALGEPAAAAAAAGMLAALGEAGAASLVAGLGHPDPIVRRWAAAGLAAAGERAAGEPLQRALQDTAGVVRAAAASALGALGVVESGPQLLRLLVADPLGSVRAAAARALGRLKQADAADALRQGLADPLVEVRESCHAALAALGVEVSEEFRAAAAAIGRGAWEERAVLSGPVARELLLRVLEEPVDEARSPARQAAAVLALGRCGADAVRPPLCAALARPEPEVRVAAARALGELGPAAAAQEALLPLATAGDAALRGAACDALGRVGGADALPVLQQALAADPDPAVRRAALVGLGWLGRREAGLQAAAAATLRDAFAAAAEPELRAVAAAMHALLGGPGALEPLGELLDSADPALTQTARQVLAELGLEEMEQTHALQRLLPGLADPSPERRAEVAGKLGRLGVPEALEPLRAALQDPEAQVRAAAGEALVALGATPLPEPPWIPYLLQCGAWDTLAAIGPAAVPELAAQLDSPDAALRLGATKALAALAGEAADAPLLRALADQAAEVRRAAACGLGARRADAALPALLELLGDPDSEPDVATALAALGEPAAAPLLRSLDDGPPEVAFWAAQALGRMGHAPALAPLVRLLDAARPELRLSAAQALGQLGLPEAVPPLLDALQRDLAPAVRQHAALALGRLGDRQAAPLLRAHLGEPYGLVRQACREALASLGEPPAEELLAAAEELAREDWRALARRGEVALELLLAALRTPGTDQASAALRQSAAWTLGEIGSPAALEPLRAAALSDVNLRVRAAAIQALGRLGDARAAAALVDCYGSVQPELRIACVKALVSLGGAMGQAMLAAALDDPAPEVRHAVYGLLGPQENLAAFDRLIQRIYESEDVQDKLGAIEALVQMGRPQAVDALVYLLGDANPAVRRAAWDGQLALGWYPIGWRGRRTDTRYTYWTGRAEWLDDDPDGSQVELLSRALEKSDDAARRRVAAEALGLIGDRAALAPLQQALQHDPDRDVRIVAAESLERLGEQPAQGPAWLPYWIACGRWEVVAGLGEVAVPELAAVLAEPDEKRRAGAIEALAAIGSDAAREALLRASHDDPQAALRVAAARSLSRLGDGRAVPRLVALLADGQAARDAADLLAARGAEAQPELLELLHSDLPLLRRWAAELLGSCRGAAVEEALLRALADDALDVRLAACRSLGLVGSAASLGPLLELLQRALEPVLREAAAKALGRIGLAGARDSLVAGLGDGWGEVRRACATALEAIGAPASPAQLEAMAAIAAERWSSLVPLGATAVPLLLYVAADPGSDRSSAARRSEAARVLGEIGDPAARDCLLSLLRTDQQPVVRAAAARALGRLGDPAVAPELAAAYEREAAVADVRAGLVDGLARLGGPEAEGVLTRALQDPAPEVQAAAARVLGCSARLSLAPLLAALESPAGALRLAAAEQLGRMGHPQAIDPLCGALSDSLPEVRRAARSSLLALRWYPVGWRARPGDRGFAYWTTRSEWLGDGPEQDQVPLLLAVAQNDADADRRRNAAEALGDIGDLAALPVLRQVAAADPDDAVRAVAREAAAALARRIPPEPAGAGETPAAEVATDAGTPARRESTPDAVAERLARIQAAARELAGAQPPEG